MREAAALAAAHPEIVITGDSHRIVRQRMRLVARARCSSALVRDVPRVRFRLSSVEATEVDDRLGELLTARSGAGGAAPARAAAVGERPGAEADGAALVHARPSTRARRQRLAARARRVRTRRRRDHGVSRARRDATTPRRSRWCGRCRSRYLHVFPYSARPGTAAARLGDAVPRGDRRARVPRSCAALARGKAAAHRAARAGGAADVVVVGGGARATG